MKKICIIGGGIMGMTTALKLSSNKNVSVTLIEKEHELGGMARSFRLNSGAYADCFYHYFCQSDKRLYKLIDELGLTGQLSFTKLKTGLLSVAGTIPLIQPMDSCLNLLTLKHIPLVDRLRFMLHVLYITRLSSDHVDDLVTAESHYQKWEGERAYNFFWEYLLDKKFRKYAAEISCAWLNNRIIRALTNKNFLGNTYYGRLNGGIHTLISKLEEKLLEQGVKIIKGKSVSAISLSDKTFTVTVNNLSEIFDRVVSTIPLPCLRKTVMDERFENAEQYQIRNIGCVCLCYVLNKPLTEYFWLNTDVKEWAIPGIVDFSHFKNSNSNLIYMPLYLPHDHELWQKSESDLIAMGREYISKISDCVITESYAHRYEYAQPVFTTNTFSKIKAVRSPVPGLYCADTTFSYPNDRCLDESIKIAERICSELEEEI
ncbi:FAD-dependent oxidoreductase [Succinivibrio dextrinosolvens]|uniref:FAD-dependent oxidoreductase n=1 Tax=Succinivibrio dextrinosolvens TaxID=83771 RepID=UPI00192273A9|nr:FAD-dependent oxidoreductase [Succinivibrio dextrinosolvens]